MIESSDGEFRTRYHNTGGLSALELSGLDGGYTIVRAELEIWWNNELGCMVVVMKVGLSNSS